MINFEKAKLDPSSFFTDPNAVVKEKSLSREQKIEILHRWEYDERTKMVAEEENMPRDDSFASERLALILKALRKLKVSHTEDPSPTKQGGV